MPSLLGNTGGDRPQSRKVREGTALGLKSVSTLWSGVGVGVVLGILTGKREYMAMQAFLPFLQGNACEFPVAGVQTSLLLQDHTAATAGAPSGASVAHISCKHQLVSVRV